MSTAYHAKYFAFELTKRCASDSMEKLAPSLADAQVDLNPHQVEAALFAFRSPLSKGAILADEVGLGKTIEAGILLSQKWAERKRKILIIVPASLRNRPREHECMCQKQPLTKIIFLRAQKTRSGVPGKSRRCSLYRKPIACTRLLTFLSGRVFALRIAAIQRLRCAGVRESTIRAFQGLHYKFDPCYADTTPWKQFGQNPRAYAKKTILVIMVLAPTHLGTSRKT
jgi:hypothetical protein